jgi:hypothetical protein
MNPQKRAVMIAVELKLIGVSQAGIVELLTHHPYEEIELQLSYLPFRKAKRPEAFIIEAVRNRYSPPKEFFYASNTSRSQIPSARLDQGPQPAPRSRAAHAQGHRTPRPLSCAPSDGGLEPGGPGCDLALPDLDEKNGPAE